MDRVRDHDSASGLDDYDVGYGIDGDSETHDGPPPLAIGNDERRMHVRAYNYWTSLLGDRSFPSIEDLNPGEIEDFGPHSVLLDFTGGIEDPAVAWLGATLRQECEIEGPIGHISEVPNRSLLSRLTDHYLQIIANCAPIGFEAEFTNARGSEILYRGILMPFSSDDDTIDFIYGVINWKEVAGRDVLAGLTEEVSEALRSAPALAPAPAIPVWADGPTRVAEEDELELDGFEEDELLLEADDPYELTQALPPETDGLLEAEDLLEGDDSYELTQALPSQTEGLLKAHSPYESTQALPPEVEEQREADDSYEMTQALPPVAEEQLEADDSYELTQALPSVAEQPLETHSSYELTQMPSPQAEGLYDLLAVARNGATEAAASHARSHAALYDAIGLAHDFALAAAEAPDDYAALLEDAGIMVQARSPMTAVAKLVFGVDHDKTRLTEYAAVLACALDKGMPKGCLSGYLKVYDGGLKGLIQAIRAERNLARPARPDRVAAARVRLATAPALEAIDFDDDGLAVLVARRDADGGYVIVGNVGPGKARDGAIAQA